MNIKTEFTEPECAYFRAQCNFSAEELAVFDLRVKDCSRLAIANRLNMFISTVDRRLKSVKRKIDRVIEHSMTVF